METLCKKIQSLFQGQRKLLVEFNKLIPPEYHINVEVHIIQISPINEAIEYMRRVKEETKYNPNIYKEFTRVLHIYREGEITLEDVNEQVKQLLYSHPALLENFKNFLPNCQENESEVEEEDEPDIRKKRKIRRAESYQNAPPIYEKLLPEELIEPLDKNEINFFKKLKRVMTLNSPPGYDYYLELIQALDLFLDCVITKKELFGLVSPLFSITDPTNFLTNAQPSLRKNINREDDELHRIVYTILIDHFDHFKSFVAYREVNRRKYGWFFKPLTDYETAKTPKHGYSYHGFHRPHTFRSVEDPFKDILNRQWVSVPYGTEDYSFKFMRKNAFEDALFKVEDERYDLDIMIETTSYTLKLLEAEQDKISNMTPEERNNYSLPKELMTTFRLKPINQIYSEHAERMIDLLKNNPIKTLPVVIQRLTAKVQSWKQSGKPENEKTWRETMDKNFLKSLDHRSFIFKQNEKKMTNSKYFLTDARARFSNRLKSKEKLHAYINEELKDQEYDFMGGSRNKIFFNSFSGLSTGLIHRVPSTYKDEIVEDFKFLSPPVEPIPYGNAPQIGMLPHYRLLFSCQSVLNDAIRILLYSLDKQHNAEKERVFKWIHFFFVDFMKCSLPNDIRNRNIEEFFELLPADEQESMSQEPDQEEIRKRMAEKWAAEENNGSYSEVDHDVEMHSVSEFTSDPMNLRPDSIFRSFVPLLKPDRQLGYVPATVYYFLRFFYAIYERLLKVKIIISNAEETSKLEVGNYDFGEKVEIEYLSFLKYVCMVLKGTYENSKFEDKCRSILGPDAYMLYTFDKLVNYASKAFQTAVTDELTTKTIDLFNKFNKHKVNEEMYYYEFLWLMGMSNPPLFRLLWNPSSCTLSVTYLESPNEKLGEIDLQLKYSAELRNPIAASAPLFEELKPYIDKAKESGCLDENCLEVRQDLGIGLTSGSLKICFLPRSEDSLFNMRFHRGNLLSWSTSEEKNYLFKDKNSLIQKTIEFSELRFQLWRNRWLE
jgi:histone deacetylase complex regulatory component SIN3